MRGESSSWRLVTHHRFTGQAQAEARPQQAGIHLLKRLGESRKPSGQLPSPSVLLRLLFFRCAPAFLQPPGEPQHQPQQLHLSQPIPISLRLLPLRQHSGHPEPHPLHTLQRDAGPAPGPPRLHQVPDSPRRGGREEQGEEEVLAQRRGRLKNVFSPGRRRSSQSGACNAEQKEPINERDASPERRR